MNMIKQNEIEILTNLSKKYSSLYSELDGISNKLKELEYNKDTLVTEIKRLRDIEIYTINKIEKRIGRKLTTDDVMKIVTEHA